MVKCVKSALKNQSGYTQRNKTIQLFNNQLFAVAAVRMSMALSRMAS